MPSQWTPKPMAAVTWGASAPSGDCWETLPHLSPYWVLVVNPKWLHLEDPIQMSPHMLILSGKLSSQTFCSFLSCLHHTKAKGRITKAKPQGLPQVCALPSLCCIQVGVECLWGELLSDTLTETGSKGPSVCLPVPRPLGMENASLDYCSPPSFSLEIRRWTFHFPFCQLQKNFSGRHSLLSWVIHRRKGLTMLCLCFKTLFWMNRNFCFCISV